MIKNRPAYLRSGRIVLDGPSTITSVTSQRAIAVAGPALGGPASATLGAGNSSATTDNVDVASALASCASDPATAFATITGYFSAAAALGAFLGLDGIVVMVAVVYGGDAAFIGVGIRRVVARGCCS